MSCISSCIFHILDFNIPNLRCGFINLKRVDFFSFNKEKNHLFHIFDDIFAYEEREQREREREREEWRKNAIMYDEYLARQGNHHKHE